MNYFQPFKKIKEGSEVIYKENSETFHIQRQVEVNLVESKTSTTPQKASSIDKHRRTELKHKSNHGSVQLPRTKGEKC